MTNPKGAWFERLMANYLGAELEDDAIDRQVKSGAKDRGDIRGVKIWGKKIAIECKNTARPDIAGALREAEVERGNIDGLAAVVITKRTGKGQAPDQLVTMTAKDFVAILSGERPE
jgi:hypothetical protein